MGENESLVAFRDITKYQRELKLTVIIHRLAGVDLQTDEMHLLWKEDMTNIRQQNSVELFLTSISTARTLNQSMRTGKDLEGIDLQRLSISAFNFNYSHRVIINREDEVNVAGDGNQAEPVANAARKVKTYPDAR